MGTLYIGLDVHKASISISVAEDGRDGAVRFLGEIPNTPTDVAKLAKRLAKDGTRPASHRRRSKFWCGCPSPCATSPGRRRSASAIAIGN